MYDKPFAVDGFIQWTRNVITAAGLLLDCDTLPPYIEAGW
jgi:hypothetical protein